MGMSQPLIGTFSIPVCALKTKTENKRIESIAIVDSIIEFLKGQLMKDDQTLQREGSESSFKRASSLSANAQKRMSKKLKNQANKMRGAINKANAYQAIKDGIEEEDGGLVQPKDVILEENKGSPEKAGYDQLIEEPAD